MDNTRVSSLLLDPIRCRRFSNQRGIFPGKEGKLRTLHVKSVQHIHSRKTQGALAIRYSQSEAASEGKRSKGEKVSESAQVSPLASVSYLSRQLKESRGRRRVHSKARSLSSRSVKRFMSSTLRGASNRGRKSFYP